MKITLCERTSDSLEGHEANTTWKPTIPKSHLGRTNSRCVISVFV